MGEFGFNLFTYLQLIDDLRDACPAEGRPRDLEQHKKTVPLVLLYNVVESAPETPAGGTIPTRMQKPTPEELLRRYREYGVDVYCAVLAEAVLNRAKHNLADLKGRLDTVENLEQFVRSVEVSLQKTAFS